MSSPGYRIFLSSLLLLAGSCSAAAETPVPCGGKAESVRIAEALDGGSLRLEDGRTVRLATVIAPVPIDGDRKALSRSREALDEIAKGKQALLFPSGDGKDRYGRIQAQKILIDDQVWLEAELLARGVARVLPLADDKCMTALLRHEAKARTERAGLWSEPKFAIMETGAVEALLALEGRFAVVEGAIRRVGEQRGRIYLDFGWRYTEDFTVIVPERLRKALAVKGSDPKSWRGRRIRVRGILFSWGGPAMEINLAQAIELLD